MEMQELPETLEEIDIGTRAVFMDNGGENFSLVPCLNDSADGIALLRTIVRLDIPGPGRRTIWLCTTVSTPACSMIRPITCGGSDFTNER